VSAATPDALDGGDAAVAAVADRVATVRAAVAAAAEAAGRQPDEVTIVAVSKTHPPALLHAAVAAGLPDLGENRVQELVAKRPHVAGARWHLVGPLQRNKARDVVDGRTLVHTLDRRSLADTLSRLAADRAVVQRVLVQVNVAEDPAKHGCSLDHLGDLVAYARGLPNVSVEGLMTIPPLPPDGVAAADAARPHFAALRAARDELQVHAPELAHLSMGMSADVDAAIAEGATLVRLGTAVFGARGDRPWRGDGR
jgi:pyridoxal phosphate enzyme (YggS family)